MGDCVLWRNQINPKALSCTRRVRTNVALHVSVLIFQARASILPDQVSSSQCIKDYFFNSANSVKWIKFDCNRKGSLVIQSEQRIELTRDLRSYHCQYYIGVWCQLYAYVSTHSGFIVFKTALDSREGAWRGTWLLRYPHLYCCASAWGSYYCFFLSACNEPPHSVTVLIFASLCAVP